jgi:FG-GAP-like repeat/FG-GAP repeat
LTTLSCKPFDDFQENRAAVPFDVPRPFVNWGTPDSARSPKRLDMCIGMAEPFRTSDGKAAKRFSHTLNHSKRVKSRSMRCRILLLLPLLAAACQTQSRGTDSGPFRAIHLAVGSQPGMVFIADVNKDGKPDFLTTNHGSANFSVYLGDGKGGFTQASGSPFSAGQEPNDMGHADFNGDGNPDVAIPNHSVKSVAVALGNGKGQFSLAPGSPFAVESRPHPHGITVADFNGDKKPDIAVDTWGENKILMLFGKGDGTFQTPGVKFDVGQMPYQRLRSADLNADGNADIITSNFEASSVSVLSGDGRGNFTRKDFSAPPDPFGTATADFNGDGRLDIVTFHYSGHATDRSKNGIGLLIGDGRGNFTLANGSPFPVGQYPATIAAGDLNGDSIADIVVPNYEDGTLTIYFGGRNGITAANYSPLRVGQTLHGVAIADLNQDGKGDIVVAEENQNDVVVLLAK